MGAFKLLDVELNSSSFEAQCAEIAPSLVLFDRFVVEEQFSWRVRRAAPQAARVLDTQDLHFLRRHRARLVSAGAGEEEVWGAGETLAAVGAAGEVEGDAARELASLHRSDLALVCSAYEKSLLERRMGMDPAKLLVAPFFYDLGAPAAGPPFDERQHFCAIGNFRHAPNADAVELLSQRLWPALRARLPRAQLHVFGAYPEGRHMRLHDPVGGFHLRGPCGDAVETLRGFRVQLAPLRFGAGIKGKVADSWAAGTPVVTTPIGAEGMLPGIPDGPAHHAALLAASSAWGGAIAGVEDGAFVEAAARLYTADADWTAAAARGRALLVAGFSLAARGPGVAGALGEVARGEVLAGRRAGDFAAAAFWHASLRASEYMSRWIEAKARPAAPREPAPPPPPPTPAP
eukprot:tig00000980_g6157.t1